MLEVLINSFSYGNQEVLKSIDMKINNGQIIGLVATNGMGKTTLIKIICGHLRGKSVSVNYQGESYQNNTIFMRKNIVMMPEQSDLYDELTGLEHLKFYGDMWHISNEEIFKIISQLKMEKFVNQRVSNYSLGMRQRLCFALVVVTGADYMLVDEVMNGLDPDNVELVSQVLQGLKKNEKTVIIASHLLHNLDSIADTIYFIRNKRIVMEYSPEKEMNDTLQIVFSSKGQIEQFLQKFPDMFPYVNQTKLILRIKLKKESTLMLNWIISHLDWFLEIKIGRKGCNILYEELYRV